MDPSREDFVIAIRSAFLRKGNKQKFSLLSLILFSIILLILGNFNFKIIDFNRAIIKEIIYISSFITSIPENSAKNTFYKISDHFNHYDEYQISKSKLKELANKDLEKTIITFENIELKKLINDYFVEDQRTYAKVLIDKESPFLRSIVINKGSKNGVKIGMAVYDEIYLVGKVVEVNFITSRVLLISDINSRVPITIQPINLEGIMSGFDKNSGQLQYLNQDDAIDYDKKKLIVVSSGIGGVFKSGIPIGEIDIQNKKNSKKLIVDFYRNFAQLKYVKISSHKKENINIDQSNKKTFKENNIKIKEINSQAEDIKVLRQQAIISDRVQYKLQSENTILRENLIIEKNKVKIMNKKKDILIVEENRIKFLELDSLYSRKCKKNFFQPKLFKVGTKEYKACILSKAVIKKN